MNAQKEKLLRELDTNIYKIMDSYKTILKKGQVNTSGTIGIQEGLLTEASSTNIVSSDLIFLSLLLVSLYFSGAICRVGCSL
jgi:hypothetical protein